MQHRGKRAGLVLGAIFLMIQLIPVSARHTPSSPEIHASGRVALTPEVGAILNRACKDCHSNRTEWPWYAHIAPVSWMLARDVNAGRKKFDFSSWDSQGTSAQEMVEVCDAVSSGNMPLASYTMLHRRARLSKSDIAVICNFADRFVNAE